MAKQKVVEIKYQSNAAQAAKDADKVKKGVQGVADEQDKLGKGSGQAFGKLKNGLQSAGRGFKAVGTAIKASGIGLLVSIVGALVKSFQRSEKAQTLFAQAMNKINVYIQPVLDIMTRLVENTLEFLLSGEKMKAFATNFKNFVVGAFEKAWENIKLVGGALADLVTFQFDDFKDKAGQLADNFSMAVDNVKEVAKAAVDGAKETFKTYNEQVKANEKNLDRLNSLEESVFVNKRKRQLEIARLQKESEEARFAAEDASNKNYEERFAQQDKALAADARIADLKIAQAQDELELLRLKNSLGESSREDKEAELALELEILAAQQEKASRQKEVRNQQVSLRQQQEAELQAEKDKQKADEDAAIAKQVDEDAKKLQREKDFANEKKALQMNVLDNAAQIFGQDSKMAKALHLLKMGFQIKEMILNAKAKIAEAGVDGADASKDAASANQKAIGTLNPFIIAATAAASIAGLISTMKAVTAKKSSAAKLASSVGGAAGGSAGASRPAPPSFNVIGATSAGDNLIADSINSKNNQPVKAFVVESEITAKQKVAKEARKLGTL